MTRRFILKPSQKTTNHYDTTFATGTPGTETLTALFVGVDDMANRAGNIPEGATLTRLKIELLNYSDPVPLGKVQSLMFWRPGGTAIATPIANWFSQTDPLPQAAIDIRRQILGRVLTSMNTSDAIQQRRHVHFWRGKKLIRDGDDVIVATLGDAVISWYVIATATYIM